MVSLSATRPVLVATAWIWRVAFLMPFLSGTTNGRSSEQTFCVPVAPRSANASRAVWRLSRAKRFLSRRSASFALGFFTSEVARSVGVQVKRESATFRQTPTLNVHWPTSVSASQAGSLSTQRIFAVGTPFFGSSGGTGVIDHSSAQSVDFTFSGTQSLTFETVPPAEHAAHVAWGASATQTATAAVAMI